MKFVFVGYIIIISIITILSIGYDKTKFNWLFILGLSLFVVSPIIAKFCGLF